MNDCDLSGLGLFFSRRLSRAQMFRAGYPFLLLVLVLLSAIFPYGAHAADDVVISSNTTWASGVYNVNNLIVTNGATLTLQAANRAAQVTGSWQGSGVTINAVNVQVESGARISADAEGYLGGSTNQAGAGPGGGCGSTMYSSWGGSHGGAGSSGGGSGCGAPPVYGAENEPLDLGSGAGGTTTCAGGTCWDANVGGNGGGAIRLVVSGVLTNYGTISANGGNGRAYAGGGAGGSIWVTTGTLAGSGAITANGGSAFWGSPPVPVQPAGGGGSIAVYYGVNASFTGFDSATANGGPAAGQGTVFFYNTTDNSISVAGGQHHNLAPDSTFTLTNVTIQGSATLLLGGNSTMNVSGLLTVTGTSTLLVTAKDNSAQVGGVWAGKGGTISATNVQVDPGSVISADGQGYTGGDTGNPGNGPGGSGGTAMYDSGGGSHGGFGSTNVTAPGPVYGSSWEPVDLGSGAGGATTCAGGSCWAANVGGSGGGTIRLIVTGTLTNNGKISANGSNGIGYAGGGAGGSIWATIAILTGSGTFTADGGINVRGAQGGGGGRIAVYYQSGSSFTGFDTSTAYGGNGGQNGTVLFNNTTDNTLEVTGHQQLVVPPDSLRTYQNIIIRDGSTLVVGGGSNLTATGTFTVIGNSRVVMQGKNNTNQVNSQWLGQGVTITAATLQVDVGSMISADGQGYTGGDTGSPGNGPGGSGGTNWYNSGGGSYGGLGSTNSTNPGPTYGSIVAPSDLGSGAGGATTCAGGVCGAAHIGGSGGGAIRLVVSGTLTNNGKISANGGNGGGYSGGGSGGSIRATTGTLTGSGTFTANGGVNTANSAQGGGGGRIAMLFRNNSGFNLAAVTANGGNGGAAGSVYIPAPSTLTITIAGAGSGSAHSTAPDSGINCIKDSPSGCGASFATGLPVTLAATSDWKSTFKGWSVDVTSAANPVTFTMDADKSVTATFDPRYTVKLLPAGTYFATIQEAYNSIVTGSATLRCQINTFQEHLVFGANQTILLNGGLDQNYASVTGYSEIKSMNVGKGSVTVSNIAIR